MAGFNNLVVIFLIILSVHKIHSSELLNITREAVEAGREFMTEVETPATYPRKN